MVISGAQRMTRVRFPGGIRLLVRLGYRKVDTLTQADGDSFIMLLKLGKVNERRASLFADLSEPLIATFETRWRGQRRCARRGRRGDSATLRTFLRTQGLGIYEHPSTQYSRHVRPERRAAAAGYVYL